MLATLQSDILALRHRGEANESAPPIALEAADGSIAVHACHGPMREVEVLHDQLLDLFERHADVEPRDVVVMSPAIDDYAPYVDAVFGRGAQSGRAQIPYHVADRMMRSTDEVVDAFRAGPGRDPRAHGSGRGARPSRRRAGARALPDRRGGPRSAA